jgi:hypothetical protein
MPYTQLDAAAARRAIYHGDDATLERYLREGGATPLNSMSTTATTGILSGGFNMINKATGGFTYTLPPATGSLNIIRVVVQTAITSGNGIIKTATVADFMTGMMMFATTTFGAGSIEAIGGTDALITLVAASGGQKGTYIVFIDIAPNLWLVDGIMASTTAATVVGVWA